ncbi:MAG: PilZ domain-containing protein [Candidatus Omnitrophica bacterium]|nr:PilZ domain-containing protein [Candidatus Omnitrophota bacterium]MCF7895017.1 PilZ domain-containing protein [Candidatus Omnitrophota bacterium]
MNLVDNKAQEKRRFLRHSMCFPLTFSIIKGSLKKKSKPEKTETKDISRGGLLFSSKTGVSEGALIQIKIPFQTKIFRVKANVVHCQKNSDTGLCDIGVKFSRTKEAFKVKLIEQMYLISEYRDLQSMQSGRQLSLQEASQEWIKKYSERFSRLYW